MHGHEGYANDADSIVTIICELRLYKLLLIGNVVQTCTSEHKHLLAGASPCCVYFISSDWTFVLFVLDAGEIAIISTMSFEEVAHLAN